MRHGITQVNALKIHTLAEAGKRAHGDMNVCQFLFRTTLNLEKGIGQGACSRPMRRPPIRRSARTTRVTVTAVKATGMSRK